MEIMEQQLAQARERDIATWMKDFQDYRKNYLKPLAETVGSAYAAFTQGHTGVPTDWANAVKYAEWPPDLPIPNGERLQSWKTRFGPGLTQQGDFLLRTCSESFSYL
jgi:hypothetical protein